uniref:Tetraspanin n=1 Tax=Daphnia galeata TaxID=27404 RepID=A0A8J2RV90_9CRUS|nr:unnamed protein product [Daphnia galeata]
MILAEVVMGLSLWLRYEWDFKHYVYELEAQKVFWTGPYILIASSSLTMAVSVIGICHLGYSQRKSPIPFFILGCAVSAILGLSGVAYTLNHGIFHSDLTSWLEDRFWELFHEMDNNERSARILRIIQEDIECCGPSAWQDYEAFNKVVPNECRNTANGNGNLQTDGCAEIFARWMEPKNRLAFWHRFTTGCHSGYTI